MNTYCLSTKDSLQHVIHEKPHRGVFFFSHNFPTTEDTSEVTSVASSEVTSEVYTEAIKKGNKKKAGKIADLFLITTLPRERNLF